MFENLKSKLKGFLKKSTEQLEPELPPEPKVKTVEKPVKKAVKPRLKKAPVKKKKPEIKEEEPSTPAPKKLGLLEKITQKRLSEKDIDPLLWELEIALLENDVAKEVSEAIIQKVKEELLNTPVSRSKVEDVIKNALKDSLEEILNKEKPDIFKLIDEKEEKPFVIIFFGFNGTGKTLTIAKFAKILKDKGYSVVLAAGDTFRAAAIEQLQEHATALNVPIIKQKRGADSAAVIYDAIAYAKSKGINVVLADTAGRSGTNVNLMDELKKVVRVNKPDLKIFVGDALTGNDAADQARSFNEAVGIDGSVLNKIDVDAKGGACLSVTFVTNKPILYLGTGQNYEDMVEFKPEWFIKKVF